MGPIYGRGLDRQARQRDGRLAPHRAGRRRSGAPFAVLALRVGESVEALRRRAGALQWSHAAELVIRCAEVLAAIASQTCQSHRALDPSVLWLAPAGELSLLDLGLAELGPSPTHPRDGSPAGG